MSGWMARRPAFIHNTSSAPTHLVKEELHVAVTELLGGGQHLPEVRLGRLKHQQQVGEVAAPGCARGGWMDGWSVSLAWWG